MQRTSMGRTWRWLVFAAVLVLGAWGQADAAEVNPADRLVRAPVTLAQSSAPARPAPQLAQHYRRPRVLPFGFHTGQFAAIVLLGTSAGAMLGGLDILSRADRLSVMGPILIVAGGIGAGLSTLGSLSAGAALLNDGHHVNLVVGIAAAIVSPLSLLWVGFAPVAWGLATTQVVINAVSAHQARSGFAVVPLEQGAMPVYTIRF